MSKTIAFRQLTLMLLLSQLSFVSLAAELWVSPQGSNANSGAKEKPLATPACALRKASEMRRLRDPSAEDGVTIILRGGVYRLNAPLVVRPEDSGNAEHPTLFRAARGESPILSGGVPVTDWRVAAEMPPGLPPAAKDQVWVADAPRFHGRPLEFRQMWVNNRKAIRARSPNAGSMARLVEWDREREAAWAPAEFAGPYVSTSSLEMTVLQMWEIANLRVKSLQTEGTRVRLKFHEPESQLEFEHPWPQPVMEPHGAPFFLTGAIELLDQSGEWHLDRSTSRIFYWPREGERMEDASVVVPRLETLVRVSGSVDRPVSQVAFQGIGFQHTTWMRPSLKGHVPLQAGMYLLDAYKLRPKGTPEWRSLDNQAWIGRPPAAVAVQGASNIRFLRCRFHHLASAGLDYIGGTHDDTIEGCVFSDIGGNGVQMGSFQEGDIETHLPYDPADDRQVCQRELIANNVVTDCANEDWGCVGICVGYAKDVSITHNEVSNHSYTGISLGWGWTRDKNALRNNRVTANHVHHVATHMSDTAGIYTLSAQPGTVISDNYVHSITMSPYVHDPEHWFYLYLDEGSSFIRVSNNACPAERFLSNANGPGNVWENNGPAVSEAVRKSAGLEPEFRDLLSHGE